MHNLKSWIRNYKAVLGSNKFFLFVVILLILQSVWVAISNQYPMAFDEDFHFGVIRLYAQHINPFFGGQPVGGNMYGALARDPSYLYNYLMSFPYRAVKLFTNDQTIIVITLRLINVALLTSSLLFMRGALAITGASKAVINSCLFLFVLIPITPLLAGQINYDNLFIPLTALSLLMTLKLDESITKKHRLDIKILIQLIVVCLLNSIVKYAFLPIFLSIFVFIIVRFFQHRENLTNTRQHISSDWRKYSLPIKTGLIAAIVISAGLFSQRYAVNLALYHTPDPDCGRVLTVTQCSEYGPWIRDYQDKILNVAGPHNPFTYTREWIYGMWLRTFFAIAGPNTDFQSRGPLTLPAISAIVFTGTGALAFLVYIKRIEKKYNVASLLFLILMSLTYVGTLWIDEYQAYVATGQPVAINGRYLLPVYPILMLLAVLGMLEIYKLRRFALAKQLILSTAFICFLLGGGTLTMILRSNDNWFWPDRTVRQVNHTIQAKIGPIIPGYNYPTQYLH